MIRPTCVKCGIELTCEKNDYPVIHFLNNKKEMGIDAVVFGDRWRCPQCGADVVFGMGSMMIGHDLKDDAKEWILKQDYTEIKREM